MRFNYTPKSLTTTVDKIIRFGNHDYYFFKFLRHEIMEQVLEMELEIISFSRMHKKVYVPNAYTTVEYSSKLRLTTLYYISVLQMPGNGHNQDRCHKNPRFVKFG